MGVAAAVATAAGTVKTSVDEAPNKDLASMYENMTTEVSAGVDPRVGVVSWFCRDTTSKGEYYRVDRFLSHCESRRYWKSLEVTGSHWKSSRKSAGGI